VAATSVEEMVRENLVAERIAIASYQEITRWLGDDDPTTRGMFESILAVEEEHADDLLGMLKGLERT
jgi:bacterioferritin